MNRQFSRGFTLVEMLTVMAVIAVLAGLILSVNGFVQRKAAVARAEGEIAAMSAGIDSYKADNGAVPQSGDTKDLDPRIDGAPLVGEGAKKYRKACITLYSALSGDALPDEKPDGKPEGKVYYEFKRDMLNFKKDANQNIEEVNYIQDPWGNCYGYSTAAADAERDFQEQARANAKAKRTSTKGYNPTFDLWSTAGTNGDITRNQLKWVKNW